MTYETVDVKKVKHLRNLKKAVLIFAANSWTHNNLAFQLAVKLFVKSIPHKTSDFFRWNDLSPTGFEARYTELINEYDHISLWESKLLEIHNEKNKIETVGIKQPENEEKPIKKKTGKNKGEQLVMSIRGGKRAGAGRPSKGVKKAVTIVLPDEAWLEIDSLIENGEYAGYADYFRKKAGWS